MRLLDQETVPYFVRALNAISTVNNGPRRTGATTSMLAEGLQPGAVLYLTDFCPSARCRDGSGGFTISDISESER